MSAKYVERLRNIWCGTCRGWRVLHASSHNSEPNGEPCPSRGDPAPLLNSCEGETEKNEDQRGVGVGRLKVPMRGGGEGGESRVNGHDFRGLKKVVSFDSGT
jgi:hypothetical protein